MFVCNAVVRSIDNEFKILPGVSCYPKDPNLNEPKEEETIGIETSAVLDDLRPHVSSEEILRIDKFRKPGSWSNYFINHLLVLSISFTC